MKKDSFYEAALEYHRKPNGHGKISINPTKALVTQRDLALAYSPGVAAPCKEIEADPLCVSEYTARGNLVAVVTNGTAVLGLGDIGPLAAKPVMEGKSVLFKKFANVDAIDIEINEKDPDKLVEIIAALEPSFGGINLEDIKAPECFEVEAKLKARMNIPVFHDDQHGTAIITSAAFANWLIFTKRNIKKVKLVTSGAGAAAIACLNLLMALGLPRENITLTDREGVVYHDRPKGFDKSKAAFAQDTKARTLADAIKGADVLLGLSSGGVVSQEMVKSMAKNPLVMALANPNPEILPELVKEVRDDAIICTGRSDYPNQVNNVLCFPYIFRGALDVGATTINEEMKLACVKALSDLTMREASHETRSIYGDVPLTFGAEYIIPKPFDSRFITEVPVAVAEAAMASGVATKPIANLNEYRARLERQVFKTGQLMRPVYVSAAANKKRVVLAEGEEEKVLRAAQMLVDDGIAYPVLIGREEVILSRIGKSGLRIRAGEDFEIVNIDCDERFGEYWHTFHALLARRGMTPSLAKQVVRTEPTVVAALMVKRGEADAMICGTVGRYAKHLKDIVDIIGLDDGVKTYASMNVLLLQGGTYFVSDAFVNENPSAEELCEIALMAAKEVRRFGIEPKIALLSHSDFGNRDNASSRKMRDAARMIKEAAPELQAEGEMTVTAALFQDIRDGIIQDSHLKGSANLFIMPNIDAANITYHMLKNMDYGVSVGPLLLGFRSQAHILLPSSSVRGIVNASAYACVCAAAKSNLKKK